MGNIGPACLVCPRFIEKNCLISIQATIPIIRIAAKIAAIHRIFEGSIPAAKRKALVLMEFYILQVRGKVNIQDRRFYRLTPQPAMEFRFFIESDGFVTDTTVCLIPVEQC